MKIERISENQIKCTINKEDLSVRGIMISELAYGSENAKNLFQEIMKLAFSEVGFSVDDSPLMVEAIPLSTGNLVLLVTKVSDPEELDARFSRFSPEGERRYHEEADEALPFWETPQDLSSSSANEEEEFIPLPKIIKGEKTDEPVSTKTRISPSESSVKIYGFPSLSSVCEVASTLKNRFKGTSSVYKDPEKQQYYLILESNPSEKEAFEELHQLLSEYASSIKGNYATFSYIAEHFEPIVKKDALTILSVL